MALAFRSEVVDGLLEAVGDGGVALGLDGIDLCGEARDVEGADGVGELGVDAGQLPVLAGVGGAVDAQADLGVGGERRDRGGEGLFGGLEFGAAGGVVALHGAGGIEDEQDLGVLGGFVRVRGEGADAEHERDDGQPGVCLQDASRGFLLRRICKSKSSVPECNVKCDQRLDGGLAPTTGGRRRRANAAVRLPGGGEPVTQELDRRESTAPGRARRSLRVAARRPRRRLGLAVVVVFLLAGGVWFRADWEVRNTRLVETTFATSELVGELRVLQVTDFHNVPRPAQVDQIVEVARGADPDLIALTGDLVNTSNDALDPVERLVAGLATIDAPRFYVDGNHDHWSRDQQDLHALLREYGVTILVNESLPFEGDFGRVQLVGVDDHYSGHADLATAVAGLAGDARGGAAGAAGSGGRDENRSDGVFRLVLTHSPGLLPELGDYGVDYAMCGHTHGGQIRLPLIGALYQPGGDWFPKVSKGAYTDGDATLFVDSGVGVTGPPLRLFNQSQVTLHRIGPA